MKKSIVLIPLPSLIKKSFVRSYGSILVGLSGKVSVSSSELELAILQRLPRVT